MSEAIRVLVVDDRLGFRAGLVRLLQSQPDLQVIGVAPGSQEALELVELEDPDAVVMRQHLSGLSGVATCREIVEKRVTSVVILGPTLSDDVMYACLAAGARAFLLEKQYEDLPHTIRAVARGHVVFSDEALERVLRWARLMRPGSNGQALAPNELEILSFVAQGLSNREIGVMTHASEHTVKAHLRGIMRKLGVTHRAEAVAAAMNRGII